MSQPTFLVVDGSARALIQVRGPVLRVLRASGYRVVACAALDRNMPALQLADLPARFERAGIELEILDMDRQGMNPVADIRALRQLVQVMRRLAPDGVLAYSAKSALYASVAARIAGVRNMYSQMTGLGFLFEEGSGARRRAAGVVGRRMLRLALGNNAVVIFQNPDDRDLFVERGIVRPGRRTAIVNGSGVDLIEFPVAPIPTREIRFLMIARLHRSKGVTEYIEAARLVRIRHPGVVFELVGPFDDHPSAIGPRELSTLNSDGAIEYTGATNDVRGALARCSAFVLPSYREGVPRTVLEAMASGRAIVTTDAPGCRQTVSPGINGFLVPPKDSAALAAAIEELIEQPELFSRFGRASRERAVRDYSTEMVAEQMLGILTPDS